MSSHITILSTTEQEAIINVLQNRFDTNMSRHPDLQWADIAAKLASSPEKLWSLNEMEKTGGEPDATGRDVSSGAYLFYDCSAESPKGRRSVCYDNAARDARKENKPAATATGMAENMGIELLTEEEYRYLQTLGNFDLKTSSWIKTPDSIRQLSGALFCDRRYNNVFTYHNGAESYYAARGFRGVVKV